VHSGLAVLVRGGQVRWDAFGAKAFDTTDIGWKQILEDKAVAAALADFAEYAGRLDLDLAERTALEVKSGLTLTRRAYTEFPTVVGEILGIRARISYLIGTTNLTDIFVKKKLEKTKPTLRLAEWLAG